ncbi:DUF6984 family protein [Hoylesella loescheii]|jgi:hypothetical protein|uniref:DUF6984 family protein n=1 Tax=Hoylesella loescheii TaxID=840 RepID=UPI0028E9AE82|nr:hypothetical protein [Hoylesella loescheii]
MAIENKESVRRPTPEELLLIEYLAQKGQYRLEPDWQQGIWVEPITEERIGPIAIAMNNGEPVKYKPSHVISDCMFYDADNKGVAAYLLVDDDGYLCELDLWKGDEPEILSLPSSTDRFEDIPMGKSFKRW